MKTRIRILFCSGGIGVGGAEGQLQLLVENLGPETYEVGLLGMRSRLQEVDLPEHAEVFFLDDQGMSSSFGTASKVVGDWKPDVVHTWLPAQVAIPGAVAAKIHGCPMVSAHRRAFHSLESTNVKRFAKDRWRLLPHGLSDLVVSNFPWEEVERGLPRRLLSLKRHEYIPNAIPRKFFGVEWGAVPGDEMRVIYVGRLVRHKGIHLLIKAMRLLNRGGKGPVRLDVIGTGPYERYLRRYAAKLDVVSLVTFHGFVDSWHEAARQASAFVLPSLREGMPNAMLEAAAMRMPVVVSNIPEIRAVLGETGGPVRFEPNSARSLAERLQTVLSNRAEAESVGQRCRELAMRFGVDAMISSYDRVYRELAA